jgi:hypothetical protein
MTINANFIYKDNEFVIRAYFGIPHSKTVQYLRKKTESVITIVKGMVVYG